MPVAFAPAIVAGLIGGGVMVLLDRLIRPGRSAGRFDILEMWSTLLSLRARSTYASLVIHLAVSASIAVLYALGFRLAGAA